MTLVYNLSQAAIEKLSHYVYLLVDPHNNEVFYVGKGQGQRCLTHLEASHNADVAERVRSVRQSGSDVRIEILIHGLHDSQGAERAEAAAIDLLKPTLVNKARGRGSRIYGRRELHELLAEYNPDEIAIVHPCLLFRINELYHREMTDIELYDATRGVWRIKPNGRRCINAQFALAVFRGIVREVYRIEKWFSAGSTFTTREMTSADTHDRFEFVGRKADEPVRRRYLQRSVKHYFTAGSQSPFIYVGCE